MNKFLAPRYWLTWLGIFCLWMLSYMPGKFRHGLARILAMIAWQLNHKRREIVRTNVELCFPEKLPLERDILGKAHFLAMARTFMDIGLIWFANDQRLLQHTRLEGWEHCEQAKAAGKNLILHVAHTAGLEFGAMTVGNILPGVGPYNAAKNPLVDHIINRSRQRFGNQVFERSDGMLAYTRALKKGKLLYTLTDEDHGADKSVFAAFFAQQKATLPIVGRLAKISSAAVFPTMTWYDIKTHEYVTTILSAIKEFPTSTAEEDALKLNQALEQMIELAPEEYMWTLRLFKTRPDGSKVYAYQQG